MSPVINCSSYVLIDLCGCLNSAHLILWPSAIHTSHRSMIIWGLLAPYSAPPVHKHLSASLESFGIDSTRYISSQTSIEVTRNCRVCSWGDETELGKHFCLCSSCVEGGKEKLNYFNSGLTLLKANLVVGTRQVKVNIAGSNTRWVSHLVQNLRNTCSYGWFSARHYKTREATTLTGLNILHRHGVCKASNTWDWAFR